MTPADRDAATIRRQQERIDELEEIVQQLKDERAPDGIMLPASWRLNRTEQRGLFALYTAEAGFLSNRKLFAAFSVYTNEAIADTSALVKVRICTLRKKVIPLGIEILTRWGLGYEITPASKAIIKAAIEQRAAA